MRLLLLTAALSLLMIAPGHAQDKKPKSPPASVETMVDGVKIQIDYSQPSVKGREIWGDLVPYGKVWRTGANAATTFEVNADVMINGKKLKAGKYALFTIPTKSGWTVIFNTHSDQWGAYDYDKSKDVLRVEVEPTESTKMMEKMTFSADDDGKITLSWDKLNVSFMVKKA